MVFQTLQRELTGRRARVEEVLDRAAIIASLRTPEVEFVREGAGHVRQLWEVLQLETERRCVMLDATLQAQQYYSEAAKVESWLSGQKLHLVNEERGTVRSAMPLTLGVCSTWRHAKVNPDVILIIVFRTSRAPCCC